jgi:hypothetical protein
MPPPQVDPVLGWEVEERQQLVLIVNDLLDGLGELRVVELGECLDRGLGVVAVLGVVDVLDRLLRPRLRLLAKLLGRYQESRHPDDQSEAPF